jgi:hypothetical protein
MIDYWRALLLRCHPKGADVDGEDIFHRVDVVGVFSDSFHSVDCFCPPPPHHPEYRFQQRNYGCCDILLMESSRRHYIPARNQQESSLDINVHVSDVQNRRHDDD